jgi:hypothetical protein
MKDEDRGLKTIGSFFILHPSAFILKQEWQ